MGKTCLVYQPWVSRINSEYWETNWLTTRLLLFLTDWFRTLTIDLGILIELVDLAADSLGALIYPVMIEGYKRLKIDPEHHPINCGLLVLSASQWSAAIFLISMEGMEIPFNLPVQAGNTKDLGSGLPC